MAATGTEQVKTEGDTDSHEVFAVKRQQVSLAMVCFYQGLRDVFLMCFESNSYNSNIYSHHQEGHAAQWNALDFLGFSDSLIRQVT